MILFAGLDKVISELVIEGGNSRRQLGGNFRKKVCKILSHIVIYIIEGAILHRLQYSRKYAMILLNERKK